MSLLNAFAIDSDAGGIEKNNNIKVTLELVFISSFSSN